MACASQMEAQNTTAPMGRAVRPCVASEGVGGRVIRGTDWKWGKQVRIQKIYSNSDGYNYSISLVIIFIN